MRYWTTSLTDDIAMTDKSKSGGPPYQRVRIDKNLINAVKAADTNIVRLQVETGNININYQDEVGMTALHYAAAYDARPCLRILVGSGKCNYLLRDKKGRSASELAFEYGKDYAVGRLLMMKEAQQAVKEGIVEDWSGELVED